MKEVLCAAVGIILHVYSIAQEDSLKLISNDSLRLSDPLIPDVSMKNTVSKQSIYKLKPAADIPLFAINAAWSRYAFTKINSKDRSSEEKYLVLIKMI